MNGVKTPINVTAQNADPSFHAHVDVPVSVQKMELATFEKFARRRLLGIGQMRRFEFKALPDWLAKRLNDALLTKASSAPLVAAGVAVVAQDSKRVLMLQRAVSEDDPASGKWEFPGGKLDEHEDPYTAAIREWQEETGMLLPYGQLLTDWTSANGIYRLFVYQVPSEESIRLNLDSGDRHILNPDDPDGDGIEVLAWWYVDDIKDNPAVRREVLDTDLSIFPQVDYQKLAYAVLRKERGYQIPPPENSAVFSRGSTNSPRSKETLNVAQLVKDATDGARVRILQTQVQEAIVHAAARVADESDYDVSDFTDEIKDAILAAMIVAFGVGAGGIPNIPASMTMQQIQDLADSYAQNAAAPYVEEAKAYAEDAAGELEPYIDDFGEDLEGMSVLGIAARAALYGGPVWGALWRGRTEDATDGGTHSVKMIWHAVGDSETCDLCDEKDGEEYTEDTLPNYPGEGYFSEYCDGGPNCRCVLEFIGGDEDDEEKAAFPDRVAFSEGQIRDEHGRWTAGDFMTREEHQALRARADAKIAAAPVPSAAAVAKARADLQSASRPGGESRGGSAADRRNQRVNLFREFDGQKQGYVGCHICGVKMHYTSDRTSNPQQLPLLERGKIFTKVQGGGYQLPNLLPECRPCNAGRGSTPIRTENLT